VAVGRPVGLTKSALLCEIMRVLELAIKISSKNVYPSLHYFKV